MSTCKKPLAIGIAKSDEGSQLSIGRNVLVHIVCKTTQTSELEHGKVVMWPKTLTAKPLKYIPPNNDKLDKLVKSVPTMNPQNNSALSGTSKSTQLNTLKPSESVAMHKNTATRKGEDLPSR